MSVFARQLSLAGDFFTHNNLTFDTACLPACSGYLNYKYAMPIVYKTGLLPTADQVIELYDNCGLPRPTGDRERIHKMYENSNLVVTAWDGDLLVGAARCITDWVWCCYLADLAVNKDYKKSGIGKELIALTREKLGRQSMLLLLSVPTAMDYYPRVGFSRQESSFIINRQE